MPNPLPQPVNKDQIRLLVASLGYKETAKRTGIKYDTIRQWACRGKWASPIRTHSQAVTTVTANQSIASLESAITELKHKSKLSLAKSVARMAQDSEQANLRHSPYVHKVAQTYAIVHPEEHQPNNILDLRVLIAKTDSSNEREKPVIDID